MSLYNSHVYVWPSISLVQFKEMPFVLDRGLHFGDGIFETFRFSKGQIPFLTEHMDRLKASLKKIFLEFDFPMANIQEWIKQGIKNTSIQNGIGKLIISRGSWNGDLLPKESTTHTFLFVREHNKIDDFAKIEPVRLKSVSFARNQNSPIVGVKTLNYFENIFARREAVLAGYDDGLFFNLNGDITESTTSNIFFIKDNLLKTPAKNSGLLNGVTRKIVLDLAQKIGLRTEEKNYQLDNVKDVQEIFLTNSSHGITPVSEIAQGWKSNGSFAITSKLHHAYWEIFNAKISPKGKT